MKQIIIDAAQAKKKELKSEIRSERDKLWEINAKLPHHLIIRRENIIKNIERLERELAQEREAIKEFSK